ncbi:hypothetical protein [Tissierella sp.]|uniref:hypothetical protein n=1 Tax=Tissierella sp. TaxID=41274 RepID=UPI0028A63609|nr:hypothetical protein [Tissierella sp.]
MDNSSKKNFDDIFTKEIIKAGKWTLLLAIPFCFFPPLYLWIRYGAIPDVKTILTGWFLIASIYGAEYFVTPISYFPILGVSGTYMAFLSGNIANMRVPCAVVAQDVLGVESGTPEAEIVATLGMAGSIITNIIVVTIAAFAGKTLFNYFPPIVIEALDFVLPSIFGALFALFAVKYPKYGVFGISIAAVLLGVVKVIPTILLVPICVFSTIGFSMYSYKKKCRKINEE